MAYVNADRGALMHLMGRLDEYQAGLRAGERRVLEQLEALNAAGSWADEKYLEFRQGQMERLHAAIAEVSRMIEGDLQPFLAVLVERLREYEGG